MSMNWGYKQGQKMLGEMGGLGKSSGITVKTHIRGPRGPNTPRPQMPAPPGIPPMTPQPSADMAGLPQMAKGGAVKATKRAPPKAMPPSMDIPHNRLACGGAVKKMAKGGEVKSGISIKPANKGLLHKELGVAAGENIPAAKIAKAKNSSNPAERKRATFAANAAKWNKG